ncbi:GroES-like protein [Cryphonectria parasitica EP155]|uniref:GroES-like protein n=1 Tax=Cryphonectria parasitica (strain ATCC 38755 / EP155) TaxID=660469 RepID=A0A9P5CUB4_CRYP1|nr:GroES-like protein [Cryphonectria parasitica EP155]KAF3771198.1 GroES-like protein [Cryphonectria parasitica EP155]
MTVPDTFKAAVVPEPGAKHIVTDRSLPSLSAGEVAIKIAATAINPVDWKIRDYKVLIKDYPAVLGSDAAGTIAAVGPDVTGFNVGDRVFFQGIIARYDASTFQQYCKMPAALVGHTPTSISDDQAAGVSLATIAVVTGFYDRATGSGLAAPWEEGGADAGRGKAIVVLGGSSSVGQYAIQLAKLSGFEKVVTNASAKHAEFLKSLGADVVLDRARQNGAEDFRAAVGDTPLAFVFDAISEAATQALGVEILAATGTGGSHVITVQGVNAAAKELGSSKEPKVDIKQVMGLGSSPGLRYLSEPLMRHLGGEDGYIAKGKFVPNRPLVVSGGLAELETALAKNKKGISGEKVVIRPFDA